MPKIALALAALALALAAAPAGAFHRQTPPSLQLTATGEHHLPRLAAFGNTFVVSLASGGGQNIYRYTHSRSPVPSGGLVALSADNHLKEHPTVDIGGGVVAWDAECDLSWCPEAGRQIFMRSGVGAAQQITHDPTGTSENPTLNGSGNKLAFESEGDLAVGSNEGGRQIFTYSKLGFTQVSHGLGDSRNPALSRSGRLLVFDSTTDPVSGLDTQVPQIWTARYGGFPTRITAGAAASSLPVVAGDGRFVAFESLADLGGGGGNTNVPQIYGYGVSSGLYYRLTNHPSGCTGPSVDDISHDWRVGFSCGGKAYVHHVIANVRFVVPLLDSGDTPQAAAELGTHFLVVPTTSNLAGGTTAGHQLYLLNLYKLPVIQTASDAIQF